MRTILFLLLSASSVQQGALNQALPLHKVPDAWNLLPLGQNGAGAGIKSGSPDGHCQRQHATEFCDRRS